MNDITAPILPFFIASDRRTGSYLLMSLLRHTQKFGLVDVLRSMSDKVKYPRKMKGKIGDMEIIDIFNDCLKASVANNKDGKWGLKLYPTDIPVGYRYWELLGKPPLKWIFLRRKDKIAQGLSIMRLKSGGKTHLFKDKIEEEEIRETQNIEIAPSSNNRILTMAHIIQFSQREIVWLDFFNENNIDPHEIFYEDFMEESDREETVAKILDYLGIDYDLPLKLDTEHVRTSPADKPPIYDKLYGVINRFNF